jgi:hypothetical protein
MGDRARIHRLTDELMEITPIGYDDPVLKLARSYRLRIVPNGVRGEGKLTDVLEASLMRRIKERRKQLLPGLYGAKANRTEAPRRR